MTGHQELNPQSSLESFTDDIIGVESYTFNDPRKKEFLPWHRPRKQFVREKQWTEQISNLIAETPSENGIIKYLGLPGDDLLDLRHFHDNICVPKNLKLKFLGFNKGIKPGAIHKADLEVSLDEVRRLSHIDSGSDLICDELTSIAVSKSIARDKSEKMGPYDVINIDLCDGFAKQPFSGFKETHYNTLSHLMGLQSRRPSPWLLFVTTRTDSGGVNENVFKLLKDVYLDNLNNCSGFLEASSKCFSVGNAEQLDKYCSEALGYSNVFLTAICKWISKLGIGQRPASKIELKSVFGYKVRPDAESPDLISIALKIIPTLSAIPDPIGLANQPIEEINECVSASRILRRVHKQKDVDHILSESREIMDQMCQATTTLLEQARYDVSGYTAWLKSHISNA
jgi:hypothetical protein